jgi:hypothetical protein
MRSASTSRISDPKKLYERPRESPSGPERKLGEENMNEPMNGGRGVSRATPVSELRPLAFMGTDGGSASDRPTVYAKVSMGENPRKVMRQAAPAPAAAPAANVGPGQAPLSIQEASDLRDAITNSQPGAEFIFKSKGCPGLTQDSFAKLAALKSRLSNFLATAREGNTFPVNADDLDLMDRVIACSMKAEKQPDKWAYVILGTVVAGTILAVSL